MIIIGNDKTVFICHQCTDNCVLIAAKKSIDPEYCPFLSEENCKPDWEKQTNEN